MKKTLIAVTVVLFLFSCNSSDKKAEINSTEKTDSLKKETSTTTESKPAQDLPLITGEGIGEFKIGSVVPKTVDNFVITKRTVVEQTEEGDYEEPKYFVSQNGEELFVLSGKLNYNAGGFSDTISEIQVLSNKIRTAKGLTINQPISNLLSSYPDHMVWYTYIGAMFVTESPSLEGVQFLLDEKGFTGKVAGDKDSEPVDPNQFKKDTKIQKIRIIGKLE